jgi:hypothetical protein
VAAPSAAVVYGSNVTVTYTVTASGKAYAGKTVKIGTAEPKGAFTFTDATTSSSGVVTFTQKVTEPLQVKLLVPASDSTLEATSTVSSFTVKSQLAVTSPAKGTLKIVLTGATGQSVQVQRLEKGRWITAKTYTAANPEQSYSSLTSGTQYRVIVPNTTTVTGATSPAVKVL